MRANARNYFSSCEISCVPLQPQAVFFLLSTVFIVPHRRRKKQAVGQKNRGLPFFGLFPSLPPCLCPSVSPRPSFSGHGKTACIRKIFCRLRSGRGGATESAYLMKMLTTDFGRTGDKIASRAENPNPPLSLPCTPSCIRPLLLVCISANTTRTFSRQSPVFPFRSTAAVCAPADATNGVLFPRALFLAISGCPPRFRQKNAGNAAG